MRLLSAIVHWSLHNRPIVLVATLLLILFGVRAARDLPIDAVPDVTNIQVQVITSAPALSPVEVEQYVSIPIERAMAGMPKVTEIRSISRYGLSVVTVVFADFRARSAGSTSGAGNAACSRGFRAFGPPGSGCPRPRRAPRG